MTSVPPYLSGQNQNGCAYFTIRDRLPVIITKIIDQLHRRKTALIDLYGEGASKDLKEITGRLAKLKNEMQTDKPLIPFSSDFPNLTKWTKALEDVIKIPEQKSWFSAPWLFIETYMYQRIYESFILSNHLKEFDYFKQQKDDGFFASLDAIVILQKYLLDVLNESDKLEQIQSKLSDLLQIALWSNQCDLSISAGSERAQKENPILAFKRLQPFILADDSKNIIEHILMLKGTKQEGIRIDFVLDNAGFELFCDLCLAHFLTKSKIAKQIRFYVKCIPWYVSDTSTNDLIWTLNTLNTLHTHNDVRTNLPELAEAWLQNLSDSVWVIEKEYFWTQPSSYDEMKEVDLGLYKKLSEADLVIFKGDLNYRKLVGDRNWDTTTSFESALRGFHPAALCSLRTLKADVVVGLKPGQAEEALSKNKNWMVSGEYAVIQFCGKVVS